MSRTTPSYRYDPNLGNPRDRYTNADVVHPEFRQPEVPGTFTALVEGETIINTMHGRQTVAWRAEPGAPCVILGYWEDGTVHLRWAAIAGHYRIDGRFPAWVAAPDPDARMAGGGRILRANELIVNRPRFETRTLVLLALVIVLLLIVVVLLFIGR